MPSFPPECRFAKGLLIYGTPQHGGLAGKGFVLQPPDLRGASSAHLNNYQDRVRSLLANLGEGMRAQLQWSCSGDYQQELTAYYRRMIEDSSSPARGVIFERWKYYWDKMHRRELRREQLVLFLTVDIQEVPQRAVTAAGLEQAYDRVLDQLAAQFQEMAEMLQTVFGDETGVAPMGDFEHFVYCSKFLNPSLAHAFHHDYAGQFHPELSMQENCWHSEGVGLQKIGFYSDQHYHTVLTLKRWPTRTYPGIIYRLTGLPFLDYQITVNLEALPAKREVEKEETAAERLRGEYEESGRHSLLVALGKKERKIESLSTGFIRPFAVTYIVRVWDETEAGLSSKCTAIKHAITNLGGAQYYECALPSTAKKLFFASWPGWTKSSYRHRALYAEDSYLADILPFSATFIGHLAEAEALFEGSQNNLVGLRTFIGSPATPQHAVLLGASGAGKSAAMRAILEQTAPLFHYTIIVEEGLSYESFTRLLGGRPVVIHPDGEAVINYFDTRGTPLGQLQVATAVALVSRMIGEASDPQAQQARQAMIGRYVSQLYDDTFTEWSLRHREELPKLQRMACATHAWKLTRMPAGTTDLEAFADLRDHFRSDAGRAEEFVAGVSEEQVTAFLKNPATARLVMAQACALYRPEDFPTHAGLVELMRFGRFSEHAKAEVDQIATLLGAWCASGPFGKLFDGPTNISLTGTVAHFELGQIPEQAVELKTAAGLLISGFTRQHILSLPRNLRKRILWEEFARIIEVPGGEKIVAESYAQYSKFRCWAAAVVQQYGKFKQSRVGGTIIGNCKQFFLMRQFDRSDVESIARDIGLPETVCASIQNYPMPEQQAPGKKFSSLCFFSPVAQPPLCGTVRHVQLPDRSHHEKAAV